MHEQSCTLQVLAGRRVKPSHDDDQTTTIQAHLMKHRSRLHKATGLTEAQKSIVDHILLDKIKAKVC